MQHKRFTLLLVASTLGIAHVACADDPDVTNEAAIGISGWQSGAKIQASGGPGFGVAKFVTRDIAVGARLAGSVVIDPDDPVYFGVFGPHVQAWLGKRVWIGGGGGFGVTVPLAENSEPDGGLGLDARVGFAFRDKGKDAFNLSLEALTFDEPFETGGGHITTVSVMLGYQSF